MQSQSVIAKVAEFLSSVPWTSQYLWQKILPCLYQDNNSLCPSSWEHLDVELPATGTSLQEQLEIKESEADVQEEPWWLERYWAEDPVRADVQEELEIQESEYARSDVQELP